MEKIMEELEFLEKYYDDKGNLLLDKINGDSIEIEGELDLIDSLIKTLPDNLKIRDSLYLCDSLIETIPDNLEVGRDLDLQDSLVRTLPDSLKIGRGLYLGGSIVQNYPLVHGCGRYKRTIYLTYNDRSKIQIGCFIGTQKEAINKIKEDYEGNLRDKYISQVNECFELGKLK